MDVGSDPRFAKHLKKAKAGLPLGAILQSMRVVDGCSDAEIEAFRAHIEGGGSTTPSAPGPPAAPRGPPAPPPPGPPPPGPPPPGPPAPKSPAAVPSRRQEGWRQRVYPLLQAGPSAADPAASLRELEAAVRATLRCDISCWDHGRMRDLLANGGSGGYLLRATLISTWGFFPAVFRPFWTVFPGLGAGFLNLGGKTEGTAKKWGKNGKKWARNGLKRVGVS